MRPQFNMTVVEIFVGTLQFKSFFREKKKPLIVKSIVFSFILNLKCNEKRLIIFESKTNGIEVI